MGKDSSQEMRRTQAEKMLKQPKKLRAKWISRLFTLIMVAALSVATMGLLIKTTVLNADFTSKELAKDENISPGRCQHLYVILRFCRYLCF